MADITSAAEQLQEKLRSYSGVVQIRSDNTPGKNEFRLTLKPEARSLGLTVEDLALQVNAGFYGREAFRVQRGQDDIRVKVRYTLEERSRVTADAHPYFCRAGSTPALGGRYGIRAGIFHHYPH